MFKAIEFCLPNLGKAVPAGAEWFHEIKYDGYACASSATSIASASSPRAVTMISFSASTRTARHRATLVLKTSRRVP
jgi:hypothetical protein